MAHAQGHGHLHHRTGPPAVQESTFHVHHPWIYIRTLILLVILMFLTVALAQIPFWDLKIFGITFHGTLFNNLVAMTIAVIKALLVISFFMGVIYGTKLTKLWAAAGFVGFALLFLALGDYSTRVYEPTPRWSGDPGSSMRRSVPESRSETEFKKYERTGRF
jgi:cytochrome c oxidase subunit 4